MNIVIMAAGKGTRMNSDLPKVLHCLTGFPMVQHVLSTADRLAADNVLLVVGYKHELVRDRVNQMPIQNFEPGFVVQEPQLGTGHAVLQAVPFLHDDQPTVILNGDVPLINESTIAKLYALSANKHLALLTVMMDDPTGYGRIVRDIDNQIVGIVEHKDCTPEQREIKEVYTGIMAAPTAKLREWVQALGNDNAQREYYLTDIVKMAVEEDIDVLAAQPKHHIEVMGVNSPEQLNELEELLLGELGVNRETLRAQAALLITRGVQVMDIERLDLRGTLEHGTGCVLDINVILKGHVELGNNVVIGAGCVIEDAEIGDDTIIEPYSVITSASIGSNAHIGPFARLRPGTDLGHEVHIGNFVEVKNSTLKRGAKANHLAYVGDADLGERVNFGAGAITANYDGANKHHTEIGDNVHVGSNCVLVAPVVIPHDATIGSGTVLRKEVGEGLTFTAPEPINKPGWKRPVKKK